jgi:competence protein ComEC
MRIGSRRHAFMFPLALLAFAFALGALIGLHVNVPRAVIIPATLVSGVLSTTALLRRNTKIAAALVTLSFLLSGLTLALLKIQTIPRGSVKQLIQSEIVRVGEPVEITGVLQREPEIAPGRRYLNLRVERIRAGGSERESSGVVTLLVAVPTKSIEEEFDQLELRHGARIRVMTSLSRADEFRNPGVSSFTEYLDRKGYDATGFVKSPLLIERLDDERVFLPLAWIYEWRRKLQKEFDSRLSSETAGVLDAALLGNRYNLSHSTAERFRAGGTFHVLVISGLHITFLGGLIFFIARWFTRNRVLQFLAPVAVVWGYSIAVGAEASVVRAALMFTVVLMAPLVSRRASSLNALGGVAIALLVWRPSDLLDPSFQLTFVSVLAIVVLAWPLLEKMSEIGSWRPTRATPYPPACAPWLRSFSECLFWSERKGKREIELANYSYRLFKASLAERLEQMHVQRALRYMVGAVVVSVAVQVMLMPFLVIYFHRLSPSSFVLNITVGLLMAGVTAITLAGLAIAQVSAVLAEPLFSAANALNWLMIHSVDPFEAMGLASLRLPEYAGWAAGFYVLYYLPLTMLAVVLFRWQPLQLPRRNDKHRRRKTAWAMSAAQLLLIALVVFHPWSAAKLDGKLRIDFLDVGQGDAALMTLPDGTTVLVDGGGQPGPFNKRRTLDDESDESFQRETRSIGEMVVSEYLWWRGLDHVDYLIATHADADHIDGLNDVAGNFAVRAALVARSPGRDIEYSEFAQTLSSRSIPLRLVGAGDEIRIGDVSITVLWPPPSMNSELPFGNNDSVVLKLKYGSRTVLLTADIEAAAEKSLLKSPTELKADAVKVAHHGSKTSSSPEFIAATKASFAIISVGQTSIFGHPNKDVVERWKGSGAEVLTTGNSGTITVTTNGTDLKVERFIAAGNRRLH